MVTDGRAVVDAVVDAGARGRLLGAAVVSGGAFVVDGVVFGGVDTDDVDTDDVDTDEPAGDSVTRSAATVRCAAHPVISIGTIRTAATAA